MLTAAKLSLYTPFGVSKEYHDIEAEQILAMFKQATDAALEIVAKEEILGLVGREKNGDLVQGELLLLFDYVMQDYIMTEFNMGIDQFRAVLFSHTLVCEETSDTTEKALDIIL